MSREEMLNSKYPLARWEREDLETWLKALREDCEMFGATTEDRVRMAKIRHRLGRKAGDPD